MRFTQGISTFICVTIISSEPLTCRGFMRAGQRLPWSGSGSQTAPPAPPPEPHSGTARLAEARHAPPVPFQGRFWQATHIALTPCEIRIWPLIPVHPGCCPPQSRGALLPPKYSPCSCLDLNKAVNTADLLDTQKKTIYFEKSILQERTRVASG